MLTRGKITEGLKLELLTSLLPSVNEKAAKINATYKKPNVHTVATLDVFKVKKKKRDRKRKT
jgi:voltage-dependent anion channel protein 2